MSLFTVFLLCLGGLALNFAAAQYALPDSFNPPRFRLMMVCAAWLYAVAVFGFITSILRTD